MANLLCLAHRLPCPPDKGDKVRAFHLIGQLAARHRVHLGTFLDDARDAAHVPALQARCASLHVARLRPVAACLRSLRGLSGGEALTLRYHRDAGLARWVRQTAAREPLDAAVVFSCAMAPYLELLPRLPSLVDFGEVDSARWAQWAPAQRWPLSWIGAREGERLLAHERAVARRALRAFFATEAEAALFRGLAPECADRVEVLGNGVDAGFFSPQPGRASPFGAGTIPIVFTGAMDCWPNADAASWFAHEVLPRLLPAWPALRFHVVGRSPSAAVRALASDYVAVSGSVPDLRPYLQHAAVVVAPLRVARGIRTKILEAMAMERPVVASPACVEALGAHPGVELLAASQARDFARKIDALLRSPAQAAALGRAARLRVLQSHGWAAQLRGIERPLAALGTVEAAA